MSKGRMFEQVQVLCFLQEGVRTLSVRAGVETVFWTCIVLMEVAYAGAIGVGLMSPVPFSCSADCQIISYYSSLACTG